MPGSPQEKENSGSLSVCAETRGHTSSFKTVTRDLSSETVTAVLEGSGQFPSECVVIK